MVRVPQPGTRITIVKLSPEGREAARYQGTVLPGHPGWVVAEAGWSYREVESGPLRFALGDRLIEYFSLVEPVSAFAVFSPDNRFKGWYANVCCPLQVETEREVHWRDLYIDVVVVPGLEPAVLDQDELEATELEITHPEDYQCILFARDRLLEMIRQRLYPFSEA